MLEQNHGTDLVGLRYAAAQGIFAVILRKLYALGTSRCNTEFVLDVQIQAGCRMAVFLERSWGAKILVPLRCHSLAEQRAFPLGITTLAGGLIVPPEENQQQ